MRTVVWVLLAGTVLLTGCNSNSAIAGKWAGSVMDRGKVTKVALDLQTRGEEIGGTITVLEGDGGAVSGAPIALFNAHRTDGKLEFTVPVSGQIDAEAVFFELLIKGSQLEGYGRKMKQGSQNMPAVFVRQKQ